MLDTVTAATPRLDGRRLDTALLLAAWDVVASANALRWCAFLSPERRVEVAAEARDALDRLRLVVADE